MIKEIKKIKEKVKQLLIEVPHLRDSDRKLISTFWWNELPKSERNNMLAFDFLQKISQGQFTSSESIRRCRCKVQEENEWLRGKSYKKRKKYSNEFKKEINNV